MSNAVQSFGTYLQIGDGGSPEAFTTIAEVGDISGPDFDSTVEDVTSHSTGQPWRDKIVTLLNAGQLVCDLSFIPQEPTHSYSAGLLSDYVNRTKRNIQIIFADAGTTTWKFSCYVKQFKMKAPVAGVYSAQVAFELCGQPTLE